MDIVTRPHHIYQIYDSVFINHINSDYVSKGLLALAEKKLVKANENFQRALKYDPRNALLQRIFI